ncbi:hypothetical protein ERJ75_000815900 [Trypanosoma vivax]|nr:hypothetical protein ERJ75_000815900 [Trypanosoma vivax]
MGGAGRARLGEARAGRCERSHLVTGTEREECLGTMMDLGRQPAFGAGCGCCSRYASRGAAPTGKSSNTGEGAGSVRGVERAEGKRSVGGEIDSNCRGEKHRAASAARAGTGNSESSARDMRKQGMHGPSGGGQKEAEMACEFCADVEREARRLRDASRAITASTGTWPGNRRHDRHACHTQSRQERTNGAACIGDGSAASASTIKSTLAGYRQTELKACFTANAEEMDTAKFESQLKHMQRR